MKQNNVRIIGVTGGIGTGKSTVSRLLEGFGAVVLDADQIAKKVVAKGSQGLQELLEYFGTDILDPVGELDRKKLAGIIFNDAEKLNVANAITHKYVIGEMMDGISLLKQSREDHLIVLDVPIPVKHGFLDCVDEVWVVVADPEVRVRRVMERNGWTREEVLRRISVQMSDEEYKRIGDRILENNGSLEALKAQVEKAYFN